MIDETRAIFGVAGFPPAFFESTYRKKRENIFEWLNKIGLDWVELQNTYGVKMKDAQAYLYKQLAQEYGIGISLHAPYYITLASADEGVVDRSKERILQCFCLAEKIGASRIIFHPGHFPGKQERDRKLALDKIVEGLNCLESYIPEDIYIYPETAGKKSQIGSVDEIIYICSHVKYARPCIDVAHVHGFENGILRSAERIYDVLDLVETKLGRKCLEETHFHMYPVEIDHNGEKRHKAFEDRIEVQQLDLFQDEVSDRYYPLPEHFIHAIKKKKLSPVVICEARDSQERGALLMKKLFYGEE